MKNKVPRWFDHVFAAVLYIAIICSAIAIWIAAKDTAQQNEKQEPGTTINIDSLRRSRRALIEKQRESKLKTREDSIHHFEDGM